jgi:cell division septal protein FtsQ
VKRSALLLAAVASAGLLLASVVVGPRVLRRVSLFRVRRVELVGTRYLAPEQLVRRLGLRRDENLFDDTGAIERRAEQIAGVVSARVERRLPGTLRVLIVERAPIALAPGPDGLVALDQSGKPLPYDPAATGLDLPVVPRPDSLLLSALARVRAVDSTLYQEVQTAELGARGSVILDIGKWRLLLDGVPSGDVVHAVTAVRRHLAAAGRVYTELDARFQGWVVVRQSRL